MVRPSPHSVLVRVAFLSDSVQFALQQAGGHGLHQSTTMHLVGLVCRLQSVGRRRPVKRSQRMVGIHLGVPPSFHKACGRTCTVVPAQQYSARQLALSLGVLGAW